MTKYVPVLVRISLAPEHWQALHELAQENHLTLADVVSCELASAAQKIIDDAEFIELLSAPTQA